MNYFKASKTDFQTYKIPNNCPMCNKVVTLGLSQEEMLRYSEYVFDGGKIQDILPELTVFEREFLVSGYCPSCQEYIFGKTFYGNKCRWTVDGQELQ